MRALIAAIAVVAALGAPGCGPSCSQSERIVTEGVLIQSGQYHEFQTSPPEGPFLPFEGGTTLRIQHQFGFTPSKLEVFLSFTANPLASGHDGYSQAAGNQAIVLRHDDQQIAIWNASCASYFIRVVVSGVEVSDAGTDATADATAGDTGVSDAADDGG